MKPSRGQGRQSTYNNASTTRSNHILAIAIDAYSGGQPLLQHPVAECERLIELLTDRYDFHPRHIRRMYNGIATRDVLRDELYELPESLGPNDNLLLLFAGHGYYDETIDEGYWIPVDAPLLNKRSEAEDIYFPFQRIVKFLNRAAIHHIVFVIDSCFGGKFGQVTMKVPSNLPGGEQDKPSRWVMTSGRIELVADDSPFAHAMWDTLFQNTQARLPLPLLYAGIRTRMGPEATQTAYCDQIVEGGAKGGEFTFHLQSTAAATAAPELLHPPGLLRRLRQGSAAYLNYLKQGRFARMQFERLLLPDAQAELLDVPVSRADGATPLRRALEHLWSNPQPHTLLCGEGGTGKTVSCVRLWEELLEQGEEAPVPIFLPLNEYNAATPSEREHRHFLFQFIAREYLDDARLEPNLEEALKQLFREQQGHPTAILLLDGFNEVATEKRALMVELAEFVRRAKGVQILVTSRYEMRHFAWTEGFERLDLLPLTKEQIADYLAQNQTPLPEDKEVATLLRNPMMLTLYTGTNHLSAQFAEDARIHFRPRVSSRGELLHNFIEGLLAKYLLDNALNPDRDREFLWQAFLLRHLLPYLAHRLVEEGQYFIYSRKLLNPAFNFKSVIGAAYDFFSSFDFTDLYPAFEGQRRELAFGIGAADYDAQEARNRRIRMELTQRLFLLSEEGDTLRLLHQTFRDYFAAVHVLRSLEISLAQNRQLPPEVRFFPTTLHARPLDFYVRQLVGELEGEHYHSPVYLPEERRWSVDHVQTDNLLGQLLELCRGVSDDLQLGYTIWNILTIWREQRGELSGTDLRQLTFQDSTFNGCRLSRPGLVTRLDGATIAGRNFFPPGHSSKVYSAVFSPNGKHLLTASFDNSIKTWDAATGTCLSTFRRGLHRVRKAIYSPDGLTILTIVRYKEVKVWDASTGGLLAVLKGHEKEVNSAAFSPDGSRILTASDDGTIKIWDAYGETCLATIPLHSGNVSSAVFHPDGTRILTGHYDTTAKIWDADTGALLQTLEGHTREVNSVAYSPDGNRIATGSRDGTARIWDPSSGACLLTLQGHKDRVTSVVFSPDSANLLTAAEDKMARVWDLTTGDCLLTCRGHAREINQATYSPDGKYVLTASNDHTSRVWDAATGDCLLKLSGYSAEVNGAAYHPDGTRILTAGYDRTTKVWDAASGTCLLVLQGHSRGISSAEYSPDGTCILTGSRDYLAKVWDAATGACLLTLKGHTGKIRRAAYRPDGQRILTASHDRTAKVWDADSGDCLITLDGHYREVNDASYAPDGRRIVTASKDKSAHIWDAETGASLARLRGHNSGVNTAAFSPDGRQVITAAHDRKAKIWDAATGRCLLTLQGHTHYVTSAVYEPGGARVLTASYDRTAKVWDATTGECLLTLKGHTREVNGATFRPDGARILTASHDHTVKVWDAETGNCLMTLFNIPGLYIQGCDFRNLDPKSPLSNRVIEDLRSYGGLLTEEDAARWEGM